jgi:hypothetical protein
MIMKLFSAIEYQRQLIVASLDDFSPNSTLPNYLGGQYGLSSEIWRQAVVEFLCINVKCGFIEATHRPEIHTGYDIQQLEDMLLNGDRAKNIDSLILWNGLHFNGTTNLIEMVEKFDLRNWSCVNSERECRDFIDFLKKSYGLI